MTTQTCTSSTQVLYHQVKDVVQRKPHRPVKHKAQDRYRELHTGLRKWISHFHSMNRSWPTRLLLSSSLGPHDKKESQSCEIWCPQKLTIFTLHCKDQHQLLDLTLFFKPYFFLLKYYWYTVLWSFHMNNIVVSTLTHIIKSVLPLLCSHCPSTGKMLWSQDLSSPCCTAFPMTYLHSDF